MQEKKAGEPRRTPTPEVNTVSKKERTSPSMLLAEVENGFSPSLNACRKMHDTALTVCLFTSGHDPESWFLDSGATAHICREKEHFSKYMRADTDQAVMLGNSMKLKVQGTGTVVLNLPQ